MHKYENAPEGEPYIVVQQWPGHPVSYTTTRIELLFGDTVLATGTGFVMHYASHYGLVTNWHVFSGRSPIDEKCISKTGGIPNRARFHVALVHQGTKAEGYSESIYFQPMEIKLYRDEDMREPVWFDDRATKPHSDYVVLPLWPHIPELQSEGYSLRHILGGLVATREKGDFEAVPVDAVHYLYPGVGRQVFIIGYPAGIDNDGIFPIWKGGTVATEPYIERAIGGVETKDVFLVDGLTRSGMSGAPVVCLPYKDEILVTDGGFAVTLKEGEPLLLGVYAGREGVTQNEADLALGRVWKIHAIEQLFGRAIIET